MSNFPRLRLESLAAVLLLSLLARGAPALEPGRPIAEYGHRVWVSQSGLPQDAVNCLLQTGDGYLWIGTNEGLVRFDGVHFTTFDHTNAPELRRSAVRSLYEDREGALWIGSNSGVATSYKDGRFTHFPWRLGPGNVLAILQDHEGSIWFGTDDGLFVYREGQLREIGEKHGLTSTQIWTLAEDKRHRLWIGAGGSGLWVWENGKPAHIPKEHSGAFVSALMTDGDNLWVGGLPGLRLLRDGRPQGFTAEAALSRDSIASLYKDREGYLWVGTRRAGIKRLGPQGDVSSYGRANGLSSNEISSILEDPGGSLWIGTRGAGLNQLRNTSFRNLGPGEGLAGFVRAVTQDQRGDVWIATDADGLRRMHNRKLESYPGLPSAFLRCLFVDQDNSLWVGTAQDTLYHQVGPGKFEVFTVADGFIGGSVKSLVRARDGSLWISSSVGVSRYDHKHFTNFTTSNGLAGKEVTQILEAHDGTLWFATSGGLSGFRNGTFFASITDKDGLSSNLLRCLYEDQDGVLWIGTRDGGLNRLKGGKITVYDQSVGLARDVVFSIIEDADHNLWMSSTRGIFRVAKKELNDFAEGRIHSISSAAYGAADGMLAEECSGNVQPAAWQTRDGRLWYPTVEGIAILDPRRIYSDSPPERVILEEVLADKKPVAVASPELVLPPGEGDLEFHYTAIDFTSPEKSRFEYRLEGFDRNWTDAGTRRVAYYTNIPPGRYRFRVVTMDGDLPVREAAALDLRLLPHYYQSRWFWAAVILLSAGAIGGICRLSELLAKTVRARRNDMNVLDGNLQE
jgi:ligand-binding sensor domain-containing protein